MELLSLIPALPLAGFVLLVIGRRLPPRAVAAVGCSSVGASAAAAIVAAIQFLQSPPAGHAVTRVVWQWISVGDFRPAVAFRLDALSLVMVLVVTVVGFLIHVYSAAFMAEEPGHGALHRGEGVSPLRREGILPSVSSSFSSPGEERSEEGARGGDARDTQRPAALATSPIEGYGRFFAYMNLFVGSMLILVLADNLLLLYLGWEGVGLCSYLLIGFWYKDRANGRAAMKAFLVTRVGDAALGVGLFLIYFNLGTLDIQPMMQSALKSWPVGSPLAVAAALLLLGGAVGKSAQLPLQTWLPDAMAGPSPVSALIHAATMVTAGVYLIARTHVIFELAPAVMTLVAVIGAATLLLAGASALVQRDLKRVLAYSTISQIGYMFLALGAGAWSAAIFHFMTHAFFKSLLFLAGGAVILKLHEEHDMFRMGGLRKAMPLVFWTFLIGAASLSALPLVTAGFYSKDLILSEEWGAARGGPWLWAAGLVGAILTALYAFRMVFLTFFGPMKQQPDRKLSPAMAVPLVVLAGLSIVGGFVQMPASLGGECFFGNLLQQALPPDVPPPEAHGTEIALELASAAACLLGVFIAWLLYLRRPATAENLLRVPACAAIHKLWLAGWGFDWLYDKLFVRPLVWIARINKEDAIDLPFRAVAGLSVLAHRLLSRTQTGRLRWYAACLAGGAVIILAALLW